ncbi:MAG: hypothetical protein M3353_07055, partial [Actinomycetota bacterium]|nr:hypothetical protein [Actinomycetota bacterium]
AAEQTAWTRQTMDALLATAEQEAQRIREMGHADAARHLSRTRRRVANVVGRLRMRLAEAERQAAELGRVAAGVLATAEQDAERIRADAQGAAIEAASAADHAAALVHERAQRRLDDAEAGAHLLRERVAAEVIRNQRTAQDELRHGREQAAQLLAEAREEADAIRAKAGAVLERARAGAAALARRRDEIAEELSGLSGVIDALAVPAQDESPPAVARPDPTSSADHHAEEEQS